MYHEHNSADFDFPFRDSTDRSYLVASIPRSGSTLLCLGLWDTRLAGAPLEYFADVHMQDYFGRWGKTDIRGYVSRLLQHRTSPNGVFGVKGIHTQLRSYFFKDGIELDDCFPNLRYIYIARQDRLRQAISLVKAMQTNRWRSNWTEGIQDRLSYDFQEISRRMDEMVKEEQAWQGYFLERRIEPLRIVYESLVQNYEESIRQVLSYLGVAEYNDVPIPPPSLKKQADIVTEEWYDRFLREV